MPPHDTKSKEISVIVELMQQMESLRSTIDEQFRQTRDEISEHKKATDASFREIRDDMAEIKERLVSGDERLSVLRRDLDKMSLECDDTHKTHAAVQSVHRKEKAPAWQVALIAAVVTAAGTKIGDQVWDRLFGQQTIAVEQPHNHQKQAQP